MRFLLAALCAVFATPALAGTNEWTFSSGNGCPSAQPNWAAYTSCAASAIDVAFPGHAPHHYVSFTEVTAGLTHTRTGKWQGSGPERSGTASFTRACGTLSPAKAWNDTFGGCAEICAAPDTLNTATGLCESPPDCSVFEGVTRTRWFAESSVGGPICTNPPGAEVDGCEALVAEPSGFAACAGGECFAQVAFTGNQCGGEEEVDGESLVDEPGNTNCVAGGGVTVCAQKTSRNCGTVNGQAVCLESVPPGRCAFLGNGGMVCGSEADGPTEEDGVTSATPDGTFSARGDDAEEQELRYFGPATVASSGSTVAGSFQSGSTDEEEEVGGAGCEVGAECGVALELPELEEGDEPGVVASDAIEEGLTPIETALAGLGVSLPAGECPTASFALWDETEYVIDAHCALAEAQAATLEAVMLFVWAFFGVRILMET